MLFTEDPDLDDLNDTILVIPLLVNDILWNLKKVMYIPWIRPLPSKFPRSSPDEFFALFFFILIFCWLGFSFKKTYIKKKQRLALGQTTLTEIYKSYLNFIRILLQNCTLFCLLYPILYKIF